MYKSININLKKGEICTLVSLKFSHCGNIEEKYLYINRDIIETFLLECHITDIKKNLVLLTLSKKDTLE